MEKITGKRLGRPRNIIPDDRTNRQAEGDNATSNGNRTISGTRPEVHAESSGVQKDWEHIVKIIHAEKRMVVRVWHPVPRGTTLDTNKSEVQVIRGEPSYQLSTGEIIKL